MIEPGDEKHDVDVGGDDLLLGGIAGGAAREVRRPRQDGADAGIAAGGGRFDDHPVADGGKIRAPRGIVAQPAGHAREALAVRRHHAVDVRVLEAHARRGHAVGAVRLERGREPGRPAEIFQSQRHRE